MGYSPQGHKESDVTEQLNNNNYTALQSQSSPGTGSPHSERSPFACHPLLFSEAGVTQKATEPRSPDPFR